AAPAVAQNAPNKSDKSTVTQPASNSGLWQASKLINMNVYNDQNEKIGDIKELMVDKSGKIESVAIAVGGFLGVGGHDVSVKLSELKWVNEPVKSTTSSNSSSNNRPATTGTSSSSSSTSSTKRNYPDHAVLSATKDQLKAMPQFDYNK